MFKDINLPLFFAGRVSWLLLMMLLLSGPIVVACLLTDVSLGHQPLRFTAQRVCACHAHQERRRGFSDAVLFHDAAVERDRIVR